MKSPHEIWSRAFLAACSIAAVTYLLVRFIDTTSFRFTLK